MEGTEGVGPLVAEEAQPLGDLAHAATEEVGDIKAVLAAGDPEDGREALVDALVMRLVATAFKFLALLWVKVNRLHWAPSWANPGPPRAGDRGWVPTGIAGGFRGAGL